jgi:GH15 family glucan-1,4-alpha-glucosidase
VAARAFIQRSRRTLFDDDIARQGQDMAKKKAGPDRQKASPPAHLTAPVAHHRSIADHAVIGNLATVALVTLDGTIDFMCWPRFDSPTIFAALLDNQAGGVFELAPEMENARIVQTYLPDTNVLVTRWMGTDAVVEVTDLMPPMGEPGGDACRIVRRVAVLRGKVTMRLRCAPRPAYAREVPKVQADGKHARFQAADATFLLRAHFPIVAGKGEATAAFTMVEGESTDIVFEEDGSAGPTADHMVVHAIAFWRRWARRSTYRGRWRGAVQRASLLLKLLVSHEHGSMVAAATFGLPEADGGERNWDYRATWIRDASFAVYGLMRLGYTDEAIAFNRWVADRVAESADGRPRVMYAVDGSDVPDEVSLDHLAGYGGARPVRIGNAAAGQLQMDIYGELMDSIYLTNKYGESISHDNWDAVVNLVDHVCEHWKVADAGIWEIRSHHQEHLHSRLMCWVTVDRAIRLASKRSLAAPFDRWIPARNALSKNIWEQFFNPDIGHFVRTPGSTDVDGAMLMMPLVRFISATDPAWLATLEAIEKQLADGLVVRRYTGDDGLPGDEGAFAACSFWYVECLARAGRREEAEINFEKLLAFGNHVGLFSEEFDARGCLVGNFPQAFTHLALISAAFYLNRQIDDPQGQPWPA